MKDVFVVTGTARLTRDPELRALSSGTSVCKLGLAWSTSKKDGTTGEWTDVPNYINMTVWGNQGEACAKYLSKGRQVIFSARLEYRSWETEDGSKRSVHELVAEHVQFVGSGDRDGNGSVPSGPPPEGDPLGAAAPVAAAPPMSAPPVAATPDDDIPF